MKTTVVPAQITSVEDRIAGNLSFRQMILLIAPVFMSAGVFMFLPPLAQYHPYKVVMAVSSALICIGLAIRIKGRLVIEWFGLLSRYNRRPRYYVYDKNHMSGRPSFRPVRVPVKPAAELEPETTAQPAMVFTTGELLAFEAIIHNPESDFHFRRSKKGGLRVHIKEVK